MLYHRLLLNMLRGNYLLQKLKQDHAQVLLESERD